MSGLPGVSEGSGAERVQSQVLASARRASRNLNQGNAEADIAFSGVV